MRERVMLKKEGRLTIPKKIRDKLKIKEGSLLELCTYPTNSDNPNKILIEVIAT